ncbi:ABC transporter ATP-binding protein [Jannaschia seohaensis]|uniref:Putative ABC transport system ATP-binding protein/lipoprotein-releasing system ATP-binding protein n=1 Tax=Jannaschia seohaensis TaxID=475081 RepID=A0A2Y9AUQ9_9RHOB|nr:ATP-binding cassette domain-containing protein [Jannaschia seohaensis]PWJ17541.1 putative ABC transport system ATP-binding protein/lipoprotein-releasing system ATP-binding protein [Jannaschia seohaensis]SSA47685.1 putative ABC transport system ATP-binding protein/lipoprotein-releasing system ATP-binding protein [Jannaschia seohaensis]
MIEIRDLRFAYGSGFALSVPVLDVAARERVAVVGPSGAGKTTLLNLVSGIAVPDAGRVTLDGRAISALPDRARRAARAASVGFVFQEFALVDYLSAEENVLYPYRVGTGLALDKEARARARALLAEFGLGEKTRRRPAQLSQGERQRVAIARALVTRPKVILADEATGNLDPANKAAALDLLFAQAAETGAALLCVTHDHELLPRFDRVIDFADLGGTA